MKTMQEVLAGVEFKAGLEDNEMVSDALVLMRVTRMDTGLTFLAVRASTGTDAITISGLLHASTQSDDQGWTEVEENE